MSNMLESYNLSCRFNGLTKDYTLKFKVAKGVKVSFSQAGDLHKIDLYYDSKLPGGNQKKNYKITGSLNVQFFQHTKKTESKGTPEDPEGPSISIKP